MTLGQEADALNNQSILNGLLLTGSDEPEPFMLSNLRNQRVVRHKRFIPVGSHHAL